MSEFYQKYKETFQRYEKSDKGKARQKRYQKSKKGKIMFAKANARYRRKLRDKAIDTLGGQCSNPKCFVGDTVTEKRILQIDHIHGDGNTERDSGLKGYKLCKYIVDNPKKAKKRYQLLCANCNLLKAFKEGKYDGKHYKYSEQIN